MEFVGTYLHALVRFFKAEDVPETLVDRYENRNWITSCVSFNLVSFPLNSKLEHFVDLHVATAGDQCT